MEEIRSNKVVMTLQVLFFVNVEREINLSSVWKYNPSNYTALKQIQLSQLNKSFANDDLIFDSRFECGNLRCVYASLK